jgi:hypothetical protein
MAAIEFNPTGSLRKLHFSKKTNGRRKAQESSSKYKFLSLPISFSFLILLRCPPLLPGNIPIARLILFDQN